MPSTEPVPVPLASVLSDMDGKVRSGLVATAVTWRTGFDPLDTYLSGGLRAGELVLLGGPQGLGKTTMALQMARSVAQQGGTVLYVCFEHDEVTVTARLLAMEGGEQDPIEGVTLRRVVEVLERGEAGEGLAQRVGQPVVSAVAEWSQRLHFVRANGATTGLEEIARYVAQVGEPAPVVVIDYLQKVAVPGGSMLEAERVTTVVEGLKDLALTAGVAVLAIVAADTAGISQGRRTRTEHLRGSSALAYEADVILMMNDKYDAVARHHLVYDTANAERFHDYVVVSVEKNRSGLGRVDLEFRTRFEQSRFERQGSAVHETLTDDRIHTA